MTAQAELTQALTNTKHSQACASCQHMQTLIKQPRGSELKELIVNCQAGHSPIWLFSGSECCDYEKAKVE